MNPRGQNSFLWIMIYQELRCWDLRTGSLWFKKLKLFFQEKTFLTTIDIEVKALITDKLTLWCWWSCIQLSQGYITLWNSSRCALKWYSLDLIIWNSHNCARFFSQLLAFEQGQYQNDSKAFYFDVLPAYVSSSLLIFNVLNVWGKSLMLTESSCNFL